MVRTPGSVDPTEARQIAFGMKNPTPALPLLLAALSLGASAPAPRSTPRPDPLAGFDAQVVRAVKDWRTPGLAIAVVKEGEVIFSRGYGLRDIGHHDLVDAHTLFAIGSTTKAITAAAIGMLVEEKRLGWDDAVTKHLP